MELEDENIAAIYVGDDVFYDNLSDLKLKTGPTEFTVIYKNGQREGLDLPALIQRGLVKKVFLAEDQVNIKAKEILDSNKLLSSYISSNPSTITGAMSIIRYLTKEKAYEIAQDYFTYHWT